MAKANGAVIYNGPSMIDGEEIVVIATGLHRVSKNPKTGDMVQVWILRADTSPHVAAKNGDDYSICGDCPLRFNAETGKRSCYVRTHEAPLSIWRAWNRGSYPVAKWWERPVIAQNRMVRLGAYGDPAAVPVYIWNSILTNAAGWTGYTHQWASNDPVVSANARAIRKYCMASVESFEAATIAHDQGWRTFRTVARVSDRIRSIESACPADPAINGKLSCEQCKGCSGSQGIGKASRVIVWHGAGRKNAA